MHSSVIRKTIAAKIDQAKRLSKNVKTSYTLQDKETSDLKIPIDTTPKSFLDRREMKTADGSSR